MHGTMELDPSTRPRRPSTKGSIGILTMLFYGPIIHLPTTSMLPIKVEPDRFAKDALHNRPDESYFGLASRGWPYNLSSGPKQRHPGPEDSDNVKNSQAHSNNHSTTYAATPGNTQPIDSIFVPVTLLELCQVGYLAFGAAVPSDHRVVSVDIPSQSVCSIKLEPIEWPIAQRLQCKDPGLWQNIIKHYGNY